jgi:hypothetical protein
MPSFLRRIGRARAPRPKGNLRIGANCSPTHENATRKVACAATAGIGDSDDDGLERHEFENMIKHRNLSCFNVR